LRIILEFDSVLTARYSGFFTYGAGLLEGFSTLADPPALGLFCGRNIFVNNIWLGELPQNMSPQWHVSWFKRRRLNLWWRWFNYPSLQRLTGTFDLYHCNHYLMPPVRHKPRVLTVHDLRRYRCRQFYPHSKLEYFENAVRKADHFIAISQATKNDLQDIFHIDDSRIDVVYHGGSLRSPADDNTEPDDKALTCRGLQKGRFFVVFSSYDKRKNISNIVRGFCRAVPKLGPEYRMVIIGHLPADQINTADLQSERVICTGPLDDFSDLLCNSAGMVYASLYEGFGLPLLEAMAAKTAVITSNCSSMPEVAGEAALLVDPREPDDIAAAMVKIATDQQLRDKLIAAGCEKVKQYSWHRAATETVNVYRKLIL